MSGYAPASRVSIASDVAGRTGKPWRLGTLCDVWPSRSCVVTRQRSRVTTQIRDLAGEIDKGFACNHAGGEQPAFAKIRVIHNFWERRLLRSSADTREASGLLLVRRLFDQLG